MKKHEKTMLVYGVHCEIDTMIRQLELGLSEFKQICNTDQS